MPETFLLLFAAHLLADFPLQPDWIIRRKRRPGFFLLHVAMVGGVAALLLGGLPLELLALLIASHAAMDAIKLTLLKDDLAAFALDQMVHVATVALLAAIFPETASQGWFGAMTPDWRKTACLGLCLFSGALVSVQVGAIVIRKAVAGFAAEIGPEIEGLKNGGYYIGCLERALVFLLILIGQPAGVGFLITAKSILRFGDIKDSSHQKRTEYIIIGTFMSFGWALLVATLTQLGLQVWAPKP